MCACNRTEPRRSRPTADVTIVRSSNPAASPLPDPSSTSFAIQTMDPERLRIEQLRREAIRRSFGK
jgi:hypothetical protein